MICMHFSSWSTHFEVDRTHCCILIRFHVSQFERKGKIKHINNEAVFKVYHENENAILDTLVWCLHSKHIEKIANSEMASGIMCSIYHISAMMIPERALYYTEWPWRTHGGICNIGNMVGLQKEKNHIHSPH